jgi:hypothetical protein
VAPRHDADFVRFGKALAARYRGSRIQSWNEPNLELFGGIRAKRAAALTNQLEAALPGRVVGPSPSPADDRWLGYLKRTYRRTAPGVPLAVNLYPRSQFREQGLRVDWKRAVRLAERQGRRAWVTEIGFAASQYGAQGQAEAVSWAYDYLARHHARAIIVHRLIDTAVNSDAWHATLAVLRPDGSPTPAYVALRHVVRREARRVAAAN